MIGSVLGEEGGMASPRLLVATRSPHKLEEIARILDSVDGLNMLGPEEAGIEWREEESGLEPFETFEENAESKARYFFRIAGIPTVADDSGLSVDALEGAPGVHSKRFSPEEGLEGIDRDRANNRHLVRLLSGVPLERRSARFVCVAALVTNERSPTRFFRGEAEGLIIAEPRGDGGFGYDPHFFDPELGRTFAQISSREKNARSHRGRAFRALARFLAEEEANRR